jgi:signal transduction histidine kinase
MTQTPPSRATDFLERSVWIWSAVYYGSLIIPAVILLVEGVLTTKERNGMLVWVAVSCVWHWFWTAVLPRFLSDTEERSIRTRPLLTIIYMVGMTLFWAQLININGTFNIHLAGLFSQCFLYMPIQMAIPSTFVLAFIIVYQNASVENEAISLAAPSVWVMGIAVLFANLFGLWISGIIGESNKRRELLEKLHQTQAELAVSERNAGALSERQRLSHEIHDTLAQGFIGIIMHLEAAAQALPDDAPAHKHIAQAEEMARQNLKQARYLVEGLRPDSLQKASLPDAITQEVARWREQSKVAAHVTITGEERPLSPDTEHALLRATQEALANVHKHAQATEATITLSYMGDRVMLDVQDDGLGLNGADSNWQGGFGLTAMRERVEQLGGSLLVESEDNEGTTVVVSIPVTSDQ